MSVVTIRFFLLFFAIHLNFQACSANAGGFPTIRSDDFCWSCRHVVSPMPKLCCTSCERAFHAVSICCGIKNLSEDAKRTWRCGVCAAIEKDEQQMATEWVNSFQRCGLSSAFVQIRNGIFYFQANWCRTREQILGFGVWSSESWRLRKIQYMEWACNWVEFD